MLCLSTTVCSELTLREAAILAVRESWFRRSGVAAVVPVIVVGWLVLGLGLALLLPSSSGLEAATGGVAFVTVWCFLSLFIWPTLSRRWMTAADQSLLLMFPRSEVAALLRKVQSINRTDVSLSRVKTTVFHPIPPLDQRLEELA